MTNKRKIRRAKRVGNTTLRMEEKKRIILKKYRIEAYKVPVYTLPITTSLLLFDSYRNTFIRSSYEKLQKAFEIYKKHVEETLSNEAV